MPGDITENNRLDGDPELEWEADHAGIIHLRKTQSKTEFLKGYGTTDFGISSYETKRLITRSRILITGIATAAVVGWSFRKTLYTYALLNFNSRFH